MSRYINAEELIRWIKESQQMTSKVRAIIAKILVMEDKGREADVVEVVRCKDCIHNGSIDTDCPFGWKDKKFNMPKPNDFCSYGE